MLLERQLEIDLIDAFRSLPGLSAAQIVGSRATGGEKTEDASSPCVVAVVCGFRSNDAFSLTPITVSASVSIVTRIEMDPSSEIHDQIVEEIANKLSYWHKFGNAMTEELSSDRFFAGELRMDGGTGRICDQSARTWSETISFSIRGSEKFS